MQRTDIFKGEFSPTGIGSAACLRRLYYEKLIGLRKRGVQIPLIFGSALHEAVEFFYRNNNTLSRADLEMGAVMAFVKSWEVHNVVGDKKRNLDTGVLTVRNYVNTYKYDSDVYQIADIECEQWLSMDNGTRLLAKIDRVLMNDNIIRVVDTKHTTFPLTDFFFKKFENDSQTSLYWLVIQSLLGRCDDIQIDAICVPPAVKDPSTSFNRRCFYRTDLQLSDAITSYTATTNYIMDSLAKPKEQWPKLFYCNTSECDKFGGCKFLDLCKHGFDHPCFTQEFTTGDEVDTETKPLKIRSKGRVI